MENLEFINGGVELLALCKPLWEKLNSHHKAKSKYFSALFDKLTYDSRSKKLIDKPDTIININLVKDKHTDLFIGYCICTLDKDFLGEIDSLYVDEDYRKLSIGDTLMKSALNWLDTNSAKTKIIAVAEGNESVLEFYRRYGFYKRRTILESKANEDSK